MNRNCARRLPPFPNSPNTTDGTGNVSINEHLNETVRPYFWCTEHATYGQGDDRMLWHRTPLAENDGVAIDLVMPIGTPPPGYASTPQWRLEIHGEEVRLPESFSTWTYLDLLNAIQEAADHMEDLLQAVPDGDTDFESLDYAGPVVDTADENGVGHG